MSHSIRKRYSYKLSANLLGALMTLITFSFVPRALGVEAFGRFDFITTSITSILGILTPGFEIAYFSWISRKGHKEDTDSATGICLYWGIANVALIAVLIWLSLKIDFNNILWPDVPVWVLWLGLCWSGLTFFFQLLSYLADGKAYTVGLEKIRLSQNVLRLIGLLIIFALGLLNLSTYFWLQIFALAVFVLCLFFWLVKKKAFSLRCFDCKSYDSAKVKEFVAFCIGYVKPIALLTVISFGAGFFDRWFLQFIGGSSQQGLYSLALRLGAMALLFTSSMTPIIMREFGHAYETNDFSKMRILFSRIEIFLFISATASIFLATQSSSVIQIFGGQQYSLAVLATSIMFLSPIHQTLGQLSTSLVNVTGQVVLYSKITIFQILISFPITYILIAPTNYILPGFGLGSTGLALKSVIVQVLITNVFLYYNTRFLQISFKRWLWIQIRIVSTISAVVYIASLISGVIFPHIVSFLSMPSALHVSDEVASSIFQLVFNCFVYCSLLIVLLYLKPSSAGLSREHISDLSQKIRTLFKTK